MDIAYHIIFFLKDSPSPASYCGVVEWQAGVRGGNPAQYAVVAEVSQFIRSDGSYESYYINKSLYDMIRM